MVLVPAVVVCQTVISLPLASRALFRTLTMALLEDVQVPFFWMRSTQSWHAPLASCSQSAAPGPPGFVKVKTPLAVGSGSTAASHAPVRGLCHVALHGSGHLLREGTLGSASPRPGIFRTVLLILPKLILMLVASFGR